MIRWYYVLKFSNNQKCVSELDDYDLAGAMHHVDYAFHDSDYGYEIESIALVDSDGTVYNQQQIDQWIKDHPLPPSPPMEQEPDTFVEWNGDQWKVEYR